MRVLLEQARGLARNLAYYRRARLETIFGQALDEIDRQKRICEATRVDYPHPGRGPENNKLPKACIDEQAKR
jgi:hypothetical protein